MADDFDDDIPIDSEEETCHNNTELSEFDEIEEFLGREFWDPYSRSNTREWIYLGNGGRQRRRQRGAQ